MQGALTKIRQHRFVDMLSASRYLSRMIFGYGYKREAADLRAAGAEKVYLDGEKTKRLERRDMLRDLRDGDVIILLAKADLGAVGEIVRLREMIREAGATIEIAERPAKRRQRPHYFIPTPEQAEQIKALWRDLTVPGPYALERASEIMGRPITRNQLNHAFGTRGAGRTRKEQS